MQNQDESGRSMVEMLGVLSIMGVIMYGAVAGINFGIDMYKINATYNEIEELAQSIVDLYSWSKSYNNLNNKIICDNDIYPLCTGTVMTNEWGGNVTVSELGTGGEFFAITYSSVPGIACERLRTEKGFRNVIVNAGNSSCSDGTWTMQFCSQGTPENDCDPPTPTP